MPGDRREGGDRLGQRRAAEARHQVAVAHVERAHDVRVVDGAGSAASRAGSAVYSRSLSTNSVSTAIRTPRRAAKSHLAQRRALDGVQPVELVRQPGRDDARCGAP